MKLQRLGGYALLASVCVLIFYFVSVVQIQKRIGDLNDPAKAMAAGLAAPNYFYLLSISMTVHFILVFIAFYAIQECMRADAPHLSRISLIAASAGTVLEITSGIIADYSIATILPTNDNSACRACFAISDALHLAVSHVYAWTFLLIGCAILKTRAFSRIVGWLCLITGVLYLPRFMFPQLADITHLLGFVTAVWIGIALLRYKQPRPAAGEMAASA